MTSGWTWLLFGLIVGVTSGCASSANSKQLSEAPPAPQEQESEPPSEVVWKTVNTDPMLIAKRLDQATFELEGAQCGYELYVDGETMGSGRGSGSVLVQDHDHYKIEYRRTDRFGETITLTANGDKRQRLSRHGLEELGSIAPAWSDDGEPPLKQWFKFFPIMIFRPISEKKPIWVPLLKDLRAAQYRVRYEVADAEVGGKNRPLGRFVATPRDTSNYSIEARFDGIRLVPLTIRLTKEGPSPSVLGWTGRWGFERTFKPAELKIFVESKESPK